MKKIFNRKTVWGIIALVCLSIISIYICDQKVKDAAQGKLYNDVKSIPYNKVGLLLGTSKYIKSGYANPYYQYRIDATIQLFNAGKIKYIVISGDNGRKSYNEPEMMCKDLMNAGIDSNLIYLDFAGFRTFDSMVRLREIFSQDSATIISQQFHNERAIFIAGREQIHAIGFNARDLSTKRGILVQIREKLARVKVFIDYIFGKEPHILGEKIDIP